METFPEVRGAYYKSPDFFRMGTFMVASKAVADTLSGKFLSFLN